MKVKVIEKHLGEGQFPTFSKGTKVVLSEACIHFPHWYACEINGYQTYIPESIIVGDILIEDYNPTELVQEVGDILHVEELVYSWLLATNKDGVTGWISTEIVVSV